MTPGMKAKELVERYENTSLSDKMPTVLAKFYAHIAVDEILKLEVWHWPHNTPEGLLFWEDVKEEINKL